MAGDWDFSEEARTRQSLRMKSIADFESSHGRIVICDFVCPTKETRDICFDLDGYNYRGQIRRHQCII